MIFAGMLAAALAASAAAAFAQSPSAARKPSYHEVRRGLFALSKIPSSPVVMLGDSLTEGGTWRELTGCLYLVNRGIGGDTSGGVLGRLDEIIALKPRAVFLMIGVNDISLGVPTETTIGNLRAILDRLERANIRSYVAYVLPVAASYAKKRINGDITALNTRIATVLADRANSIAIDLRPLMRDADGYLREDLSFDGLHLSPNGYAIWRDAIASDVARYCTP
jgi:lysophospholipase L1-like esterase